MDLSEKSDKNYFKVKIVIYSQNKNYGQIFISIKLKKKQLHFKVLKILLKGRIVVGY
jgi:hypothetical protein